MKNIWEEVQTWGEDECFDVDCSCGDGRVSVMPELIKRCSNCGRGYRSEMTLIGYEIGEIDPEHEEYMDWERKHAIETVAVWGSERTKRYHPEYWKIYLESGGVDEFVPPL